MLLAPTRTPRTAAAARRLLLTGGADIGDVPERDAFELASRGP